ncbi:MAG: hypothetical protein ABL871_13105 [Terricaulis sp.]
MGIKEFAGVFAAGCSVVFGWVAAQDQLCDMRLARPICIEPPPLSGSPTPGEAQSTQAPPPAAANAPATTQQVSLPPQPQPQLPPSPPPPQATGVDISNVQQATITPEQHAQLQETIRQYLNQSVRQTSAGFSPTTSDAIFAMLPNTTQNVPVTLNAGVTYRVLGACDDDCRSIALEAFDSNGGRIAGSDGSGDFPVLELTPAVSGQYTMRVRLLTCQVAPCYVGVRVMQR